MLLCRGLITALFICFSDFYRVVSLRQQRQGKIKRDRPQHRAFPSILLPIKVYFPLKFLVALRQYMGGLNCEWRKDMSSGKEATFNNINITVYILQATLTL